MTYLVVGTDDAGLLYTRPCADFDSALVIVWRWASKYRDREISVMSLAHVKPDSDGLTYAEWSQVCDAITAGRSV